MSTGSVVFLHLSDIHFAKPKLGPAYDLDQDLRDFLEQDVEMIRSAKDWCGHSLPSVTGILVSGDIAYSAGHDEYDRARTWLNDRLCRSAGCESSNVWCVSGNHDIIQSVIRQRPSYQDIRRKLRECDPGELQTLLEHHLVEPEIFYAPLEAYNLFAEELDCHFTFDRPFWHRDFPLNDGSLLRVNGLNSALISDSNDHRDTGKMLLGKHQCQIAVSPGVENLVVCHHPYDWLLDADDVEQILTPRCRIQLFGHKHKHKLTPFGNTLRVGAGAVHPSRNEPAWEPRYNWLAISVRSSDTGRTMEVDLFPRVWDATLQRFGPDFAATAGKEYVHFSLSLKPFVAPVRAPADPIVRAGSPSSCEPVTPAVSQTANSGPAPNAAVFDSRGNPIMDPNRTLARRYMNLGYSKRMKIASALGLLRDGDDRLPETQRRRLHLERAREMGRAIQRKLWSFVEQEHNDNQYPSNPFE